MFGNRLKKGFSDRSRLLETPQQRGRRHMKRLSAITLALLAGLAFQGQAAQPAHAGSFTVTVTPKGKKAEAISKGMSRWSKIRERINRARVNQNGSGNTANLSQSGSGNNLGVYQRGTGHSATASQDGNNNTLGIFQFGKNTSTNTSQTGNGETSFIFQGGW